MNITTLIAQTKWQLFRTLESLNVVGKLSLLLLLSTVLAYFLAYQPLANRLIALQQAATLQQRPAQFTAEPDAKVNEYIASFPSIGTRASKLNELVDIAKRQQLFLNEVTYKTEDNIHQPLNRYQVELSVLASYPEIHRFLNTVQGTMPFVTIESLNLSRENALDEAVEARIQFTFYFKRP